MLSLSSHRWASAGLEFLKLVCAPRLLATITQTQFEELKKLINRCLDHMTEVRPLKVETSKYMYMYIMSCSNSSQLHVHVHVWLYHEYLACMCMHVYRIMTVLYMYAYFIILTVGYKQPKPWSRKLDLGRKGFSQGSCGCG